MWLCLASGIFVICSNSYHYDEARTHLSLQKDAPIPRAVQIVGQTLAVPKFWGAAPQYIRA